MKTNRTTTWPTLAPPGSEVASVRRNGQGRATPAARILVPVDFSTESRSVLKYAATVGKRFRASMTLVHVVNPVSSEVDYGYGVVTRQIPDQDEVRKARARLKRLSLKMTGSQTPAKVLVLSGTPPFEITQAAKALGTDLIIMGCHGKSEATRQLGSTAEQVVRQAPCPVFVLKKKEKVSGAKRSKRYERHQSASVIGIQSPALGRDKAELAFSKSPSAATSYFADKFAAHPFMYHSKKPSVSFSGSAGSLNISPEN